MLCSLLIGCLGFILKRCEFAVHKGVNQPFRDCSCIGRFRMERSPKWGKLLRWREIMAFIYRWQGCWGHVPWDWGLCARQIAIAQSIVTPLLCPGQETICVSLDWLVALVGMMGLKKVVIVLYGWACVVVLLCLNNFSLCPVSKKNRRHRCSSYSITLCSGPKPCLKRQWYLPLIS